MQWNPILKIALAIHPPYLLGRQAKKAMENARKQASLIGAKTEEVYFTSGGTESDNLAIIGNAYHLKNTGNHIITSSIEHPAVLETCKHLEQEGFKVTFLPVSSGGIINVSDLEDAITDKTILITVMHANNEIRTIQPIKSIGVIAHDKKIKLSMENISS